jgi:outer membrane immunogenic protein
MRSLALLAAAGLALNAGPLAAGEPPPSWTGCSVSAHAGYAVAAHDATLGLVGAPVALNIDSLSASGGEIGAGLGCDFRIPGQPFVVGVFGDWTWRELEQSNTLTLGGFQAGTKMTIDDAWTVGGRAGILVNPSTLLYGLIGYTQARTSSLVLSATGFPSASFGVPDLSGWTVGGGLETQLGQGWAVRGEYRYTQYEEETVKLVPGLLNLDLKTTEHSGRLGMVYRFGLGQ